MKIFFDALSIRPVVSIGTQAYIISGLQILEKKFPNSEYIMVSSHPTVDKSYLKGLPYRITLIKRAKSSLVLQFRKIVNGVDAVVCSWGDAYVSSAPNMLFRKVFFLKKKGVPLVLFTSSIGPFKGGIRDIFAKFGLKMFDYVSVRDQITFDGLIKLGIKNVKLIHDTAFVLEPAKDDKINNILEACGIDKGVKFIGFNISVLLYHRFKINSRDYVKDMIQIINWLRDTYKLSIVLIPHQIYPFVYKYTQEQYRSARGDDRYAIDLIWAGLDNKAGVYRTMGNYSPMELKGIIRRSEVFVGGRMHSVIAAVSQCVPSLIMQYSHKAGGMMKLFNMSQYVWDITESIDSFKSKFNELWLNREKVKEKFESEMPENFKNIYALADEIKKLIP